MSRIAYSGILCLAVLYLHLPFLCFAQGDNVVDYAKYCYDQLRIKTTDVEDAFQGTNRACYYGTKLTTYQNSIALDPANPDSRLSLISKNFLSTCDAPAWLGSGLDAHQCYDATYIKSLTFSKHPEVLGALLCRHKAHDPAFFPGTRQTKDDDFDDIAMILYNQNTGKTCWFQSPEGASAPPVDGTHVPVPHLEAPPPGVPAASAFWLKPSDTAKKQCARCHDNGPWMNSNWLYSQFQELKDTLKGQYETVVYPAGGVNIFGNRPETNDFVTVDKEGLIGTNLPACTSCHKLSARIPWGSNVNGTYQNWFEYSTGRKVIPQSTATLHNPQPDRDTGGYITDIAADYAYTHWMPPKGEASRPLNATTYNTAYKAHLTELKKCMELKPADRKSPCATQKTAMLNPAPAGNGAMVSATVVQTSQSYTATAAPVDTTNPPVPQMLAVGQSIRLGWQADATFDVCSISTTMPAGVLVSATTPSGSSLIGTGANWQLPEAPPVIGPLTEPGIYDFSIYCRDTYAGSLQFQVGTAGPNSVVKLVTSVNQTVQATALHSNSVMHSSTTTDVQTGDSVELTWIGYNVRPGSCIMSGPGVMSTDDVGSQAITLSGSNDQVFTFQCTGANDGVTRNVSSTLHPVSPSCSYSISPTTVSVPAVGGTGSVSVTAPGGCSWTASGNSGWINITSGGSGSGNGTVAYSVQANTGAARAGTLTIAGQTFTVTQPAPAAPPLTASLSASTPPVAGPDPMSALADLSITVSGGTAGQRITVNVAVYLSAPLAVVPDTAQLTDASGATISAVKTANSYTFLNVQLEQPGPSGASVYTIKNMKANTASIPMPATGPAQVTAMAAISGGGLFSLNNPSQTVAFVSQNSNVAPMADSITPNSGAGSKQVFRLAYSDGNGYANLVSVSVVFTSNDAQPKECRVDYDPAHNALYLGSDAGPVRGPITPGTAGHLRNSRCVLNAMDSSAAGSGNTLTLNLALAFRPAFAGQKTILMEASDGKLSTGLQARGSWTVPQH